MGLHSPLPQSLSEGIEAAMVCANLPCITECVKAAAILREFAIPPAVIQSCAGVGL